MKTKEYYLPLKTLEAMEDKRLGNTITEEGEFVCREINLPLSEYDQEILDEDMPSEESGNIKEQIKGLEGDVTVRFYLD